MLHAVSDYLSAKRPVAQKIATYVGGGYLVSRFVRRQIDDVQIRLWHEKVAREKCVHASLTAPFCVAQLTVLVLQPLEEV